MKRKDSSSYFAIGLTAFFVIAAALLLLFALLRFDAIIGFFQRLLLILRPFTIGIVLAFLLCPVYRIISTLLIKLAHKTPIAARLQGVVLLFSALLTLLFGLLVVYLLLAMVLPQLYLSIVGLVQSLPDHFQNAEEWLQRFLLDHPDIEAAVLPIFENVSLELQNWMQSSLIPNLESVSSTLAYLEQTFLPSLSSMAANITVAVSSVIGFLKDFFIALIVCLYLLMRKDVFLAQVKKVFYSILPKKGADNLTNECRSAYRILSGFFFGKIIDSLIVGVLCLIGCQLLHFPYPALIAAVVGVFNIIPFFGPIIGAIPCFLLILISNPIQSVYFLIFIILLQQFDGNILGPKILGDTTGLDAFWILFSILLFGGLFGFVGMVLGVPVFATLYSIIRRLVSTRLRMRGLPLETKAYCGKTAIESLGAEGERAESAPLSKE